MKLVWTLPVGCLGLSLVPASLACVDHRPVVVCQPLDCSDAWLHSRGIDRTNIQTYLEAQREASRLADESATAIGVGARPVRDRGSVAQPTISRQMKLMAHMPLSTIGGGAGSSLSGWVDPQTGREYAIMGRSNGTAIVDITNPSSPVYVANVPRQSGTGITSWREPKVYQNHAYIGVDGTTAGMQVVNLTRVRNYNGTTLNLTADSVYTGVTRIHTLAVNPDSGYLYAAGTNLASGGLHVIDVRNPATPVAAGNFSGDGYTHEAQVVTYRGPDPEHQGKEIAIAFNGKFNNSDTVSFLDVSNKSNILRLSASSYPQVGYIHQGWLTEDQRYLFVNDEFDETDGVTGGRTRTHMFDVSDLDNPVYRGKFDHATSSIDHNLYVRGNLVFMSNYTTGLRVFEMKNLQSNNPNDWMTEIAYYDTYAPSNAPTFNGAWNNYPYFPSGNIVISDIDGGLFIVRLDGKYESAMFPTAPIFPTGPGSAFASVPEPASLSALGIIAALTLRRRV
jgi:choice-of-anchor B domain-containing protein